MNGRIDALEPAVNSASMGTAAVNDTWREFHRELSMLDLEGPGGVDWITCGINRVLRSESAILFSPRPEVSFHGFQDFAISGEGSARLGPVRQLFEPHAGDGDWTLYDPRRVEVSQRNRAFVAGSFSSLLSSHVPSSLAASMRRQELESRIGKLLKFAPAYQRWGMQDANHLRVLICDGPRMVAYVAALQGEAFRPVDQKHFTTILPALRRRLLLHERMVAPVTFGLVPALLEEIPSAAFVLDARDRIIAFNSAAAERTRAERKNTVETLRRSRRRKGDAHYTILELSARGVPLHALAIEQRAPEVSSRTVAAAGARFGWTPRETEIAGEIASGRTNRAIATRLHCSERTVETHVSRLLAKSDCPSRAALTAMLWSMGERR